MHALLLGGVESDLHGGADITPTARGEGGIYVCVLTPTASKG